MQVRKRSDLIEYISTSFGSAHSLLLEFVKMMY